MSTTITLPTIKEISAAKLQIDIDGSPRILSKILGDGDSNTKLRKNIGHGFETRGFSMLPHRLGGIGNVCGFASPGCIGGCLNHTGLAAIWSSIARGRWYRRIAWQLARPWLLNRIDAEIDAAKQRAADVGNRLAVRLNVFSDIAWEKFGIIDNHPDVEFYDYSKNPSRWGLVRPNYWVTFSRSETNQADALRILESRGNVAVVFHNEGRGYVGNRAGLQTLPATWEGYDVINGDETDLRFLDTRGRSRGGKVVGLKLKAPTNAQRAAAIASGFSVPC